VSARQRKDDTDKSVKNGGSRASSGKSQDGSASSSTVALTRKSSAAATPAPPAAPVETPRSKYDRKKKACNRLVLNLIMTLDAAQIEGIRGDFNLHPDSSVNLAQFVKIMLRNVSLNELRVTQDELVSGLTELFNSMDLDGNHSLEFEEFLATIVHMGLGGVDVHQLNPIKKYRDGPVFPFSVHHSDNTAIFSPELDRVVISSVGSSWVSICDVHNLRVRRRINVPRKYGAVLCAAYVHSSTREDLFDLLAVATAQCICIFEGISVNRIELRECIVTRQPQTILKWSPEQNMLFSGDLTGHVHAWRLPSIPLDLATGQPQPTAAALSRHKARSVLAFTFQGHREMITALQLIPSMDLLVTGSLDGTVRLWDLIHGSEKLKFEGHRAGVVALAYSEDYRFLFSASSDHEVGVWSPFADRLVLKLVGHAAPLVAIHVIPHSPEVISADAEGWIRVWDMRNFQCVQTFMSTPDIVSISTCGERHGRLLVCGTKEVFAFDHEGGPYSKVEDSDPVFALLYNRTFLSFVTAGRREIKIWNALNGQLSRVFRDLCDTEVTAVCLDHRDRKLIVGDHQVSFWFIARG